MFFDEYHEMEVDEDDENDSTYCPKSTNSFNYSGQKELDTLIRLYKFTNLNAF